MVAEKIGEVQLFLNDLPARVLRDFPRRKCPAHAEQAGFLEDFSGDGVDRAGVILVGGMNHGVDAFTLVHSPAGKDMVPSHESQREAALGEQHFRLSVAAHDDASGRGFGSAGIPLCPLPDQSIACQF